MRFFSWLRDRTPGLAPACGARFKRAPRAARRKPAPPRLHLEALEERWCPTFPTYNITDLGTLGGTSNLSFSQADAINNAGQVVGVATTAAGSNHAFLYSGGAMTDLGTLAGDPYSGAYALNNSGQVVGTSGTGDLPPNGYPFGTHHAFLWQSSTGMTDLGNLGSSLTTARAIDNATSAHPVQVVGDGITAAGVDHAWLWQNGVMTDLNALLPANSGWVLSIASGINDNQQIVGDGFINGQYEAYLWQLGSGAPTDLGGAFGRAINGIGQVAGSRGNLIAFLWTSPGPMTALDPLSKDFGSHAWALNNSSQVQVVGDSVGFNASGRAVLWQNGKVIDLFSQLPRNSGWYFLEHAYGINDAGWIVGGNEGNSHAFLLTPITKTSSLTIAATSSPLVQATTSTGLTSPQDSSFNARGMLRALNDKSATAGPASPGPAWPLFPPITVSPAPVNDTGSAAHGSGASPARAPRTDLSPSSPTSVREENQTAPRFPRPPTGTLTTEVLDRVFADLAGHGLPDTLIDGLVLARTG